MTEVQHPVLQEDSRPAAHSTFGARAFRGGLWQSGGQVAPYIYATITSIVAARVLGPERMGRQSFIAFVIVVTHSLFSGGIGNAIIRYVGELRGQGRERLLPSLVAWGWKTTSGLGTVAALTLVALAASGAQPTAAWLFAAVAAFAGIVNRVPGGVLIGTQRWRSQAVVVVITGAGAVAATVVVLLVGGGVSGMVGVTAVAAVAMVVWTTLLARKRQREISIEREPLGALRTEVVRFSLALSVPVVLNLVVVQRSELFFLEHFSSDTQIAYYSIAFSATAALTAIPIAVGSVMTPSVATLAGGGEFDRIRRGYSRVLRLGLLFSLPLTGAAMALGPSLLHLVYGPKYSGVGDVLLIILLTIPLIPLGGASGALLIGLGRVRAPIVVGAIAAAVDLGLAALLVPRFDAIGAAIANSAASVISGALVIGFAVRQVRRVQIGWSSVLRIAVVSALAAALARFVLVAGDDVGLWIAAAAVEVAALAIGALTLRIVSAEDAAFLVGAFKGGARMSRVFQRIERRSAGESR
ncbi:MAG: lipopolysaccharide biosynthesis protein [Gaiellaceae bacterium]